MREQNHTNEYSRSGQTYQTGSTRPPKSHGGLIAFLLGMVIFLCSLSTALGLLNIRLFHELNSQTETPQSAIAFSQAPVSPAEEISWNCLGITGQAVSDFWHTYDDLPLGIFIQDVAESSDAAAKGILPGDILLSIDGTRITDTDAMDAQLEACQNDRQVQVVIYRNDRQYSYTLTISDNS